MGKIFNTIIMLYNNLISKKMFTNYISAANKRGACFLSGVETNPNNVYTGIRKRKTIIIRTEDRLVGS